MNSGFSPLKVRKIAGSKGGRQLWRLEDTLALTLALNGSGGVRVMVPRGYVTDFASVPRPFWIIFPPTGKWCEAAVVHDYLLQSRRCSRFLADAVFREGMYRLGVPVWRRVPMFYAVRCYSALASLWQSTFRRRKDWG
jgi:hypothetical protein